MKAGKLVVLMGAILLGTTASASANGSFGFSVGYRGGHGGHHGHYRHYDSHRHHGYWGHRNYWGPRYYWGYRHYPRYYGSVVYVNPYPVLPPPVVVTPPPVVQNPVMMPPPVYDAPATGDFEKARAKKSELMNQLSSTDKNVRLQAIDELAGFSFDEQVKKALEEILTSDPDPEMRHQAAISFGKVKNSGALGVLQRVRISDSDKEVREAADWAINQIKS